MEQKKYYLPIDTPDGIVSLEINHTVLNREDENMSVTLSTTICGEICFYQAETTEDTLILLAKNLPQEWHIKSCISCRYGHFCPVGNYDNELFCVTEFEPQEPRDLWHVTENGSERKSRSRTLFDCCDKFKPQTKEYYTYSDYYFKVETKIKE